MKKYKLHIISAVVLLIFAFFFKFALVGYSFLALGFLAAAVVILAFMLLDALKDRYPRFAKICSKVITYGLILFFIILAVTECIVIDTAVRADGEEADCLIVLGAGVSGKTPSLSLVWRLEAAQEYLEEYPEAQIFCIDSLRATIGEGILAIEAAKMAASGMEAAEIAEKITAMRNNVHQFATVHTLDYLKRAGRVSATSAFLGNLMGVKPLLVADAEGVQTAFKKVRAFFQHHEPRDEHGHEEDPHQQDPTGIAQCARRPKQKQPHGGGSC